MKRHLNAAGLLPLAMLCASAALAAPRIDAVYFAQTHVQKPDSPYFKLVGNRAALIKVHVLGAEGEKAPPVSARIALPGAQTNLALRGPETLPAAIPTEPGVVQHRFDNSFTATIPAEWVRRGLQVTIQAGDQKKEFAKLPVGAPTVVNMAMFDIHFFQREDAADYPAGWQSEIEARWPVAKLNVERTPDIVFKELVVPPRPGAGTPAVRCSSTEEYQKKCGKNFDGEQMTALQWKDALQLAGGQSRVRLFLVNIYGVQAGGDAWDFGGVVRVGGAGRLHHELGHALGVLHLIEENGYPYVNDMYGIKAGGPHAGPTWGFDPRPGIPLAPAGMPYFIPPVVQTNSAGGKPGEWKRDPMQGGMDDREKETMLRMFSDWTMHKMQAYLEDKVVLWDEARKGFVTWDDAAGAYSKAVERNGVNLPDGPATQVISVIAAVCGSNPDANLVYPPIGPYTSGLILLFDPAVPADRERAAKVFAPQGGCDVCLRVEQGGKTRTYMLPVAWHPEIAPLAPESFITRGINLPAGDGKVTRAELILTPDAEKNGLPENPKVLSVWP